MIFSICKNEHCPALKYCNIIETMFSIEKDILKSTRVGLSDVHFEMPKQTTKTSMVDASGINQDRCKKFRV